MKSWYMTAEKATISFASHFWICMALKIPVIKVTMELYVNGMSNNIFEMVIFKKNHSLYFFEALRWIKYEEIKKHFLYEW